MTPGSARVKAHRQSQAKKGLAEVRVWVPKGKQGVIKQVAEKLRSKCDGKMVPNELRNKLEMI